MMAKSKRSLLENPPAASSSDDDEVVSSSGEEEEVEEQISDDSSSANDDELLNSVNILSSKKPKSPSQAVPGVASAAMQGSDLNFSTPKGKASRSSRAVESGKKRPVDDTLTDMHSKRTKKVTLASGSDSESEKDRDPNPLKKAVSVAKRVRGSPAVKSRKKLPSEGTSMEVKKKPSFHRLWSEDDEISLLQGMIDFKADRGKSPYADMDEFYKFAMKSIIFKATKVQFVEKIKKLKLKHFGRKKGSELNAKPHEKQCFVLAKYIWGSGGMTLKPATKTNAKSRMSEKKQLDSIKTKKKLDYVKPNGKEVEEDNGVLANGEEDNEVVANGEKKEEDKEVLANGDKMEEDKEVLVNGEKKVEEDNGSDSAATSTLDWFEKSFIVRSIVSLGMDETYVKQRWNMAPMKMKKKVEEKWKQLQAKEIEFVIKKSEFIREVASMIGETF